jgi:hypothetical protein
MSPYGLNDLSCYMDSLAARIAAGDETAQAEARALVDSLPAQPPGREGRGGLPAFAPKFERQGVLSGKVGFVGAGETENRNPPAHPCL